MGIKRADRPSGARPRGDGREAVSVNDLRREFKGRTVLDGIDLTVSHGEIYSFLGPNGAGKTTLVRTLCTLLLPTSGRAEIMGFDVASQATDVRLRIGAALQATALDDVLTGAQLLRMQGRYYGMSRREQTRRLAELSDLIDLGEALERPVGTYSGGMRRRLDVAMALVHRPSLVFLDEPTTGLDPESRMALWSEIRRMNVELGTTIFLTTQYLAEADELSDRVGIIDNGTVVANDTPENLRRSIGVDVVVVEVAEGASHAAEVLSRVPHVESVEVHGNEVTAAVADGQQVLSPIAVDLAGAGVDVQSLILRRASLDDVFLSVTGRHITQHDDAEVPSGSHGVDSNLKEAVR